MGLRADILEGLPVKTRTHYLKSGVDHALQMIHSLNTQQELEEFSW